MASTNTERFKRFRMQVDLRRMNLSDVQLPEGYRWLPWHTILRERHARVKWHSFRDELDGKVFRCLSSLSGCRRLLREIAAQKRFCPDATWLLAFQPELDWPAEDCGTIQGIGRKDGFSSIQNIGVVPDHRGLGLGRALVRKSLQGAWYAGYDSATLEVTALNRVAVSLYQDIGFRIVEVLYRETESGTVIEGSRRRPKPDDANGSARTSNWKHTIHKTV